MEKDKKKKKKKEPEKDPETNIVKYNSTKKKILFLVCAIVNLVLIGISFYCFYLEKRLLFGIFLVVGVTGLMYTLQADRNLYKKEHNKYDAKKDYEKRKRRKRRK